MYGVAEPERPIHSRIAARISDSIKLPSAISRQLCACTRELPMRSSQTWAAFW
jgi:hypothetical protein